MSGPIRDDGGDRTDDDLARTALVETTHADAAAAATIAAAISPDNTDDIRTTAEGAAVVTRISRSTTGGFLASVDDYLVNLDVATGVVATGRGTDSDTNDADGIRDTDDTRNTADTHDT
jgi:CheY-specific phosphatase CheX